MQILYEKDSKNVENYQRKKTPTLTFQKKLCYLLD